MISPAEQALCVSRPQQIDHDRTATLQYLGNYVRELPVSIARMMENALDWEHLPYVHTASFTTIEAVGYGRWGWRAKSLAAGAEEHQLLELLVDHSRNYWATTVIAGPAANVEIHTQARSLADNAIEVDVRFYSSSPVPDEQVPLYHDVLTQQYTLLYDEDLELMAGRQRALDDRARWQASDTTVEPVLVGDVDDITRRGSVTIETASGRFCLRRFEQRWLVHSATCPHQLGPLDNASVDPDGCITCPWHGYRFVVESGENVEGKCGALAAPPELREVDGKLYLVSPA